ncbi:glycosyltransferase [Methylomonas koyamae]|uniref:glycosyltransferase n=1 Tax=Methylomonas koyamae TaxID=702114 RepID=UPI000AEAE6DD|nr:glycosyltransferase [Methylomonas koyamae]
MDTHFLKPGVDADLFRQRWDIPDTTRVVLYSGNMGKKQGLEIVLQAAKALESREDVLFLMVGAGAAETDLKQQAQQLQLANLRFYPLQKYEELPALMALADIHLVIQKKGAADAVLPSKLSTILAVGGQAVITAEDETELGLLCQKYQGIARCIEPEDSDVLADALKQMLESKLDRYNPVAHQFALDNLEKVPVLSRLVERLATSMA